ncbi:hypothetical protein EPUS_03436 [Endocarpon pusillum Z07020]|uniref:Methyltransferase domain-containing protein n=1 Tax=Endocarpon pusillum (strain Z07020 / HMAS-L-300199) TaxID=1263415 RepID=U1GQK5_ENDPU|nr:uncharacterized protein EPUS_03436 [Endocarpon pusillum Z07020]ERF74246.1 hypothetical protein EPUS_03436 [Endocarpon pusillum Z07020]
MLTAKTTQATQTLPPDSSSAVLDDACGIGTVTAEVKKSFPDISVLAIDSSAGMLKAYNRKAKKHDFKNVTTRLLDGGNVSSDSITHAFACTFIDLAHNATACIQELHRVMAPGGVLAMNTWADPYHPSIGTPWTKACQTVYPDYKAPMVTSPRWSTPEQIKENLVKAGFKDVQTKQEMTHWRWSSPEEMTTWFFDGGNPVEGRWHESLVEECGGKLEDMREPFHQEVVKEYRNEGGHLLREELVNLTIARK